MTAFKRKALSLGVEYINAEAVGFEFTNMPDIIMEGIAPGSYETLDRLLVCDFLSCVTIRHFNEKVTVLII